MEAVIVLRESLLHLKVCAEKTLSDDDVIKAVNEIHPAGTQNGWCRVVRDNEELNPVQCDDFPERHHLILVC